LPIEWTTVATMLEHLGRLSSTTNFSCAQSWLGKLLFAESGHTGPRQTRILHSPYLESILQYVAAEFSSLI
ncbi:hypothetical protein STEG23_029564, partial [Scotinomys teguina]